MLNLSTLKVNDEVAIARPTSYGDSSEGKYTVVKADKVKVVLERESDKYRRTFSIAKGHEKDLTSGVSRYRMPFVETVEDMNKREAKRVAEREVQRAWTNVEQAAQHKDLSALKQALADLELLVA